jgi:hypothetical protein
MEDSQLCAIHANKVTVTKKDLLLARRLRGDKHFDLTENIDPTTTGYALPMRGKVAEGYDHLHGQVDEMHKLKRGKLHEVKKR